MIAAMGQRFLLRPPRRSSARAKRLWKSTDQSPRRGHTRDLDLCRVGLPDARGGAGVRGRLDIQDRPSSAVVELMKCPTCGKVMEAWYTGEVLTSSPPLQVWQRDCECGNTIRGWDRCDYVRATYRDEPLEVPTKIYPSRVA